MKNLISILFTKLSVIIKTAFFFLTILLSPLNPAQDYIRDFDGIAIETGLHWGWVQKIPSAVDSMRAAGVDVVRMEIDPVIYQTQINYLLNKGLKVIPNKSRGLNYIHYYTDAKYCIWEAEGPSPEFSDAKLEYDSNIMNKIIESDTLTYLKLDTSAAGIYDTLIKGPYYKQDLTYYSTITGEMDTVEYRTEFKLKLNTAGSIDTASSNTPLCILQVTHSKAKYPNLLECTDVIESITLTRGFFQQLEEWFYPPIVYKLYEIDCGTQMEAEMQQYRGSLDINSVPKRQGSSYIQYKLIWLGNPDYLISIDKVTLSDERGREMFVTDTTQVRLDILSQANTLEPNSHLLAGWLGFDEPTSLDIFAPIKKVSEILDNHTEQAHPLWIPWMGFWDGAFESRANIFGAMGLSPWDEFRKRVGRASIVQDGYLYDSPCWDGRNIGICLGDDYRAINIRRMSELLYKQAYNLDPYFGASIQCGAIDPGYGPGSVQRNVAAHEVLYNINLALMHGAKFLSLYTFFAQRDTSMVASGLTYHGIIDFYPFPLGPNTEVFYTDKYDMMHYILNPRLKGLFGKTLKKTTPTEQFLDIDASSSYNFICNFSGTIDCLPTTAKYDLGFFTDSLSRDYFMIISRYYNEEGVCPIYANLDQNYFSNNNLLLTKYASDTSYTIPNDASIKLNLVRGDAEFCRIVPVVHYGGDLIYDETISGTKTLTESELKIKSGARLTVSGTYNLEKDIIVESGGELVLSAGAQLVFSGNARLTVHGNLVSNGTPTNKVFFVWGSMLGSGITIKNNITLQHTRITGADVAINIDLSNQERTGTTVIRYNEFVNCITDIVASNTNSVLIQNNNLSLCDMGIFLSNVSSFNIVSNYLESQTGEMPGIFVNSSSGNIRANTITGFSNGIVCANSSPTVGGNNIFNNVFHGIYVGEGSQPDLSAALYQVPCSTPPLYYPVSGFNHIYENGGLTTYPLDDGSEIYLNNSNILLDEGSNCIIDNREERAPVYNSRLLLHGNIDSPVLAAYNEWGSHPEFTLDQRFDIAVTYAPTGSCALPDNLIDCELIIITIDGIVIDTIYAVGEANEEEEEIEEMYAEAESKYLSQNYTEAKTIYNEIITDYTELRNSFTAYSRLLTIEKIENENTSAYEQLRNFYLSNLDAISDTLLKKMVMQLANLTLISGGGLNEAIDEFQDIIDNNPGSEAADFAEIDIYTTALLNQDSILAKGKLVKVTGDNYISMVNSLINKRFSSNIETGGQIIIPVEYLLHQNYPNPFNPMTTIRYDLPKDGLVTLEIFDILGRKLVTLVNEYKSAGSYNHLFNASSYASGVYIYKLQAGDYVSSKKMILVK